MKKMLYIIIIVLVFIAPVKRVQVASLEPVETLAVYQEEENVVVRTDTERSGIGSNVLEALENMRAASNKLICLDTVENLLIGEGVEGVVNELKEILKGAVNIGPYNGGEVKEVAEYAKVHGQMTKIRWWESGKEK